MSDDIKERLLNESFKGQEAMRREAHACIEALEAQVDRLKSPAKECYHEEGCPHWVNAITENSALKAKLAATQAHLGMRNSDLDECNAQLAAAREAMEPFAIAADAFNTGDYGDSVKLGTELVTVGHLRKARAALGKDTK